MDSNEIKREENLSHEELQERLEQYQKTTDNMKDIFQHERLKQDYLKEKEKLDNDRNTADVHYAQGTKTGLPQNSYEEIQHDRDITDQKTRNQVASEAKEYYHDNHSLSQEFEKAKAPDKDIDI